MTSKQLLKLGYDKPTLSPGAAKEEEDDEKEEVATKGKKAGPANPFDLVLLPLFPLCLITYCDGFSVDSLNSVVSTFVRVHGD